EAIGDQAGRDVERAARRERHDEARRVRRPGRLRPRRNAGQTTRERRQNESSAPHWPVTLPSTQHRLLDSDARKYALRYRCFEKADKSQAAFGFWRGCRRIGGVVLDVGRQRTDELQASAAKIQNLDQRHEPDLLAFAVDQRLDHVRSYVALRFRLNLLSETQPLQQSLDIQ